MVPVRTDRSQARLGWLLILAVALLGACGNGSTTSPTSAPPTSAPPRTSAPADLTSVSDAIVRQILARQDAEIPDRTTPLILPPSLSTYLNLQKIPTLTVKTTTDPLVQGACQLVNLPHAGDLLEVAVDAILTKLRGTGGGKGIGLLVSAASLGCKYLVPLLSQKATTSAISLPLPTPGRVTVHRNMNQSYSVARGAGTFDVTVLDAYCASQTETLTATAGHSLIAADVRIDSHANGIDYDAAYWDLTTDGVNRGYFVATSDKPYVPYLTFGPLDAGQTVEGWMLFHVTTPRNSTEVMYRGNNRSTVPLMQVDLSNCQP